MNNQCLNCKIRKWCDWDEPEEDWTCNGHKSDDEYVDFLDEDRPEEELRSLIGYTSTGGDSMQTEGVMERCEWCGRRYFRPHKETTYRDGGFTKIDKYEPLPEGWGNRYGIGMLCPDCSKDLDDSIKAAKSRRIRPEIANTSEGPVVRKMVPLDDLKHCADLCIELGWTLQEFRKNMDEWDEDTVDITETE